MRRIQVIDTHTEGEPTRVVISGAPELGDGTMAERLARLRDHHDDFRTAVVSEPRGSSFMVGAIVQTPVDPGAATGVIFIDPAGHLGMCGHGTIGLAVALAHLGRIGPGTHRLETPVGAVAVALEDDLHTVSVDNVECYRLARDVAVDVPGLRAYRGDVAWGGNWFFLVHDHGEGIEFSNVSRLKDVASRIRQALVDQGVRGAGGAEIDHIEMFGPPTLQDADAKNFVLCPGRDYDRSPCGTGTSAKLACLVADGKLAEGQIWRQESIIGSLFEGSARIVEGRARPRIRGTAYVNAEATLLLDPEDPFAMGIRS